MRMPSWNALVKGLLCAALWGSSLGTPDHASAQGPGPMGGGGYEVPGMGGLPGIDGLPSGPAIPQVPYGGPGVPPPHWLASRQPIHGPEPRNAPQPLRRLGA